MGGVRLPSNIPLLEEGSHASSDLTRRVHMLCKEQKERRRQDWESHKQVLDVLKQSKGKQLKQPDKEEREVV